EGELLAMQLLDAREEVAADAALGVVRGALVRVLAVGEVEHLVERDDERVGELLARVEPGRDRGLVGGRVRERLRRQATTCIERELPARAELLEHLVVLLGLTHGGAVGEVLRRAAEHRRAADVDRLDRLLLRHAPPRGDLLERIEVDADEVEGLDPVLLERGDVFRLVAAGEDPGVDAGVKRLHAPAEHLGRGRDLLDALHRQADRLEGRRRVPARHEPPAEGDETARERVQPRLVPGGDQRAHSSLTTSGSSQCSTDLIRSCRVSGVSPARTGTRYCASTGPLSTPSSTRCSVATACSTPAASCSSTACPPGKAGSRDGWTLTTASGKRSRKPGVSRCM